LLNQLQLLNNLVFSIAKHKHIIKKDLSAIGDVLSGEFRNYR